jgi:hypothetical protein
MVEMGTRKVTLYWLRKLRERNAFLRLGTLLEDILLLLLLL